MGKTRIIIQREYLSRVKKPSFWVMTILPPFLIIGFSAIVIWLALSEKSVSRVAVVNEWNDSLINERTLIDDKDHIYYDVVPLGREEAIKMMSEKSSDYTAVLYIPANLIEGGGRQIHLYFKKTPGMVAEERIKSNIERILYQNQLDYNGIDLKKVEASRIKVNLLSRKVDESGKEVETKTGINMALGFGMAILIYMFIFLYGVQVMRGVIEEKVNRIVEIIVSSVRPFQLMLGKIIGIGMVGLTQIVLMIAFTFGLGIFAQNFVLSSKNITPETIKVDPGIAKMGVNMNTLEGKVVQSGSASNIPVQEYIHAFLNLDFVTIIISFVFYFLFGYLLYASLFAAVGSAVDNETDTQQFLLPLTIPLILGFVASQFIMQDPEGPVGFWMSIFPLTSPVAMLVRIPFGVPLWQLLLSMGLLALTFVFTTWLAGKIYRTGILMYGKKVSWKELGKWLFYKNH
jgi:ABC-2 type transport system permease protein